MEGRDEGNERRGSKNWEENTVAIKSWTCNQTWEEIYKNWSPRIMPMTIFLTLN